MKAIQCIQRMSPSIVCHPLGPAVALARQVWWTINYPWGPLANTECISTLAVTGNKWEKSFLHLFLGLRRSTKNELRSHSALRGPWFEDDGNFQESMVVGWYTGSGIEFPGKSVKRITFLFNFCALHGPYYLSWKNTKSIFKALIFETDKNL